MCDADAVKPREITSAAYVSASTTATATATANSTIEGGEEFAGATSTAFYNGKGKEGSSVDGSLAGSKDETKVTEVLRSEIGPTEDQDSRRTSGMLTMDIAQFFQKPATAIAFKNESNTNTNANPNRKSRREKEEIRRGEKATRAASTSASISQNKSAAEVWYDNLPAEHKHIVDQGIKSMFYKGCLMAIRRSFNTVVNQTRQDKTDAAAAKKKKSKRERERERPRRENEPQQLRRGQLLSRREQGVSGMPPHPHLGPNHASGSLGGSHPHPPPPFDLTGYFGGGSRENNGNRPGFHRHNHFRPPPYGYGYGQAQGHSLHPLPKHGLGSGPKQLPYGIFEDPYYGRSGRYDNTTDRDTSYSVKRGDQEREDDNINYNSSNSNPRYTLSRNRASASAETPYCDNPSSIGASAPYGVAYANQDMRDWEGKKRSRSCGGDGGRTRRRRSSRSRSVEDRPSRRLERRGRSSSSKRGREQHKVNYDNYHGENDGGVGKSSARVGHYGSRSRSPCRRLATSVDGTTSIFNNVNNFNSNQEDGINQNESMISKRNVVEKGAVADELSARSSQPHSKKSKRHDSDKRDNRDSRRDHESNSHKHRRRRSPSSGMTSYHEHKQIIRKRSSNKRPRKSDNSLDNDSCNTRDRDVRHRARNYRCRSQSPISSDDSRDHRRGRSRKSKRRKKRHRRHRSPSSSRSQPERKESVKKYKRDQSRKGRGRFSPQRS